MTSRITTLLVWTIAGAVFLGGGCARKDPHVPPVGPPTTPASSSSESSGATDPPADPPSASEPLRTLTEDDAFAQKTLEELNAERPLADALFDVDQSSLREDARDVLARNAVWLRRWTSTRITIEGHGDERGTSEYNLALGQRRSAAIKDYLVSLGVTADRIAVVSKGEEAPVCVESHESCWQRNRRGQSVITAK